MADICEARTTYAHNSRAPHRGQCERTGSPTPSTFSFSFFFFLLFSTPLACHFGLTYISGSSKHHKSVANRNQPLRREQARSRSRSQKGSSSPRAVNTQFLRIECPTHYSSPCQQLEHGDSFSFFPPQSATRTSFVPITPAMDLNRLPNIQHNNHRDHSTFNLTSTAYAIPTSRLLRNFTNFVIFNFGEQYHERLRL